MASGLKVTRGKGSGAVDLGPVCRPALNDGRLWGEVAKDWDIVMRDRVAFRVRGFTWFRSEVTPAVSGVVGHLAGVEAEFEAHTGLKALRFNWDVSFAAAQLFKAARGEVLRIDKAVKTILACELAARAKEIPAAALHRNMWIEPAVFIVESFDDDYVEMAETRMANVLQTIANDVKQPRRVIADMVAGKTVSYGLAQRVRGALIKRIPAVPPGAVTIGLGRRHAHVCTDEKLDTFVDAFDVEAEENRKRATVRPAEAS